MVTTLVSLGFVAGFADDVLAGAGVAGAGVVVGGVAGVAGGVVPGCWAKTIPGPQNAAINSKIKNLGVKILIKFQQKNRT